jgi:hypothetical protein
MTLDPRTFYFTSAATVRQRSEILIGKKRYESDKGKKKGVKG